MSEFVAPEVGSCWLYEGVRVTVVRVLKKRYHQITFRWPHVPGECTLTGEESIGQTKWTAKARAL